MGFRVEILQVLIFGCLRGLLLWVCELIRWYLIAVVLYFLLFVTWLLACLFLFLFLIGNAYSVGTVHVLLDFDLICCDFLFEWFMCIGWLTCLLSLGGLRIGLC